MCRKRVPAEVRVFFSYPGSKVKLFLRCDAKEQIRDGVIRLESGRTIASPTRAMGIALSTVPPTVEEQQKPDAEDVLVRTPEPGFGVVRGLAVKELSVEGFRQEASQRHG